MPQPTETSFFKLALEYSILVFVAGLGVIQMAAAYGGFRGLLFAPGNVRIRFWPSGQRLTFSALAFSFVFVAVTVVPALVDFFLWNMRNATGVIEGGQQAGLFMLSMTAALLFSLFFSSIINHWRLRGNQTRQDGLEALKDITWAQALWRRWVRRK